VRRGAAPALALLAAACAPENSVLPQDATARAATCTAVRALELRGGRADDGRMSFAGFAEILHFGMIHAAEEGVSIDMRRLMMVSQRAPTIMEELEEAEWRALVEPCNAAYPETQRPAGPLPADAFEGGMTCFAMADFMSKTAFEYPEQRRSLGWLADRALAAAQPELRRRARDNEEAQRIADGYAGRAFRAGRPVSLIEQCARRFPATG